MRKKGGVGKAVIALFVPVTILISLFSIPSHTVYIAAKAKDTRQLPQVLLDISWCESRDRQFNVDGSVHRGIKNPQDVGRWQVNESYHLAEAKRLGMDIYSSKGNQDFALYLYSQHGTRDWLASKKCWTNVEYYKKLEQSFY